MIQGIQGVGVLVKIIWALLIGMGILILLLLIAIIALSKPRKR